LPLVHEAYLRLLGDGAGPHFNGRGHFFAHAAQAMRKILMDNAQHKRRPSKRQRARRRPPARGPGRRPARPPGDADGLLALDEALRRRAAEEPEAARIGQLRYFAGLSVEEATRLDRHRRAHDAPVRANDGRAGAQVRQKVRR
jgi:hypothetical protein